MNDDVILIKCGDVLCSLNGNDYRTEKYAFKIENGELTEPISKAMISGNIFEIMKSIEGLNTEVKQYGSFIIPKLLVHDLRVVGQ